MAHACGRISVDSERQTSDQKYLDLEVVTTNYTVGAEGLCETLLLFETVPQLEWVAKAHT